jgi:hypothetical protein
MVMFEMKKFGLVCSGVATALLVVVLAASTVMSAAAQHVETTPGDPKVDHNVDHYY